MKRMFVAMLMLAGCQGAPAPQKAPAPVASAPVPVATPLAAAKPAPPPTVDSNGAEAVLDRMHALDLKEIESANLSKKVAHSKHVKELAAKLARQEQLVDAQVQRVAAELHLALKDPEALNLPAADAQQFRTTIEALDGAHAASGKSFDETFLSSLDLAEQAETRLLGLAAKSTTPGLKAFANQVQPTIAQEHKSLQAAIKELAPKGMHRA